MKISSELGSCKKKQLPSVREIFFFFFRNRYRITCENKLNSLNWVSPKDYCIAEYSNQFVRAQKRKKLVLEKKIPTEIFPLITYRKKGKEAPGKKQKENSRGGGGRGAPGKV